MPVYEYRCNKCRRAVTVTMSIGRHEKGKVKCPRCGSHDLQPLLSTFLSQTAKKS
jgi:putative FmdB family regulatory protein